MRSLFDLPAHPFFIHLPLVLVPFNAVAAIVLAVRPSWRVRGVPVLAASAFVAAGGAVLAARSGDELNQVLAPQIGDLAEKHQSLGETAVWLSIGFLVATIGVALLQRMWSSVDREGVLRGAMAATAVIGVAAMVWIIRTGHEGSRIVWDGVIS